MARPSGPKTRCNGKWTEARFTDFVKNALRGASRKWAPTHSIMTKARVSRGTYLCACCQEEVPVKALINGNRTKNVIVDHIDPVIDPHKGFTTWDSFIEGLFCEEENLQVLCKPCHKIKCAEEKKIETERRRNEKL